MLTKCPMNIINKSHLIGVYTEHQFACTVKLSFSDITYLLVKYFVQNIINVRETCYLMAILLNESILLSGQRSFQ